MISTTAADEAHLLCRHGEDEVGVPHPQEMELALRPAEQPAPQPAARTDADHGLIHVVQILGLAQSPG